VSNRAAPAYCDWFCVAERSRVESGGCVTPNLLHLRVLLYQDHHGPRGNGPAVWVRTRTPNDTLKDRGPGENPGPFVFCAGGSEDPPLRSRAS
jgi:hypothetical protein